MKTQLYTSRVIKWKRRAGRSSRKQRACQKPPLNMWPATAALPRAREAGHAKSFGVPVTAGHISMHFWPAAQGEIAQRTFCACARLCFKPRLACVSLGIGLSLQPDIVARAPTPKRSCLRARGRPSFEAESKSSPSPRGSLSTRPAPESVHRRESRARSPAAEGPCRAYIKAVEGRVISSANRLRRFR